LSRAPPSPLPLSRCRLPPYHSRVSFSYLPGFEIQSVLFLFFPYTFSSSSEKHFLGGGFCVWCFGVWGGLVFGVLWCLSSAPISSFLGIYQVRVPFCSPPYLPPFFSSPTRCSFVIAGFRLISPFVSVSPFPSWLRPPPTTCHVPCPSHAAARGPHLLRQCSLGRVLPPCGVRVLFIVTFPQSYLFFPLRVFWPEFYLYRHLRTLPAGF